MRSSTWILLGLLGFPALGGAQVPAATPDATRLKLGTDSLAMYLVQGHDTVRTGIMVDALAVDSSHGGRRLVRVYWSQDRVLGQLVDTIIDSFNTLQPISYRSTTSSGSQVLDFGPGRVTGWMILADGDSVAVDIPIPPMVFNAATFDLVLRASALHEDFRITVPAFLAQTRSVTPLVARVTGTAILGEHDCWVVKTEFAAMPVTFWIDVDTRQLRQQVMQIRSDMQVLFAPIVPAGGARLSERGHGPRFRPGA